MNNAIYYYAVKDLNTGQYLSYHAGSGYFVTDIRKGLTTPSKGAATKWINDITRRRDRYNNIHPDTAYPAVNLVRVKIRAELYEEHDA